MIYAATTEVCVSIWEPAEDLTAKDLIGVIGCLLYVSGYRDRGIVHPIVPQTMHSS